jgi:DNA-binding protein HU-beta
MNKRELIDTVAGKAEITKKEADAVVNATLDAIIEGLAAEGKVVIPGFGSFEVRNKTAREARNPLEIGLPREKALSMAEHLAF